MLLRDYGRVQQYEKAIRVIMIKKNNKNKYMATCVPGAEEILKDEISILIPEKNTLYFERGKVFFRSDFGLDDLLKLRCADNIYRVLNRFRIGQHKKDLSNFHKNISQTDDHDLFGDTGNKRIIVSASRSGRHTYSRYDLSDTAMEALLATNQFEMGDEKNHDFAFRIDVKDEICLFSVQLTPAEFRFRRENFYSSKGGIRPSVAHCLVRVSEPKNHDVFYDPFCGAGTIVHERSSYKYKKIFASDIDPEILDIARQNLGNGIILFQADAVCTKIKNNSIDTVVTNMPWGRQIQVADLPELYYCFIKELKRILKENGKAVILTDQDQLLRESCDEWGFILTCPFELSLHGLHPKIFTLTRKINNMNI